MLPLEKNARKDSQLKKNMSQKSPTAMQEMLPELQKNLSQ